MDTSLLVLAAGMGSRFGGLKQITPIGPNGETILDFSIYDAIEAGFNEIVFIIKKEIEQDFKDIIGKKWENRVNIKYVFQSNDNLPSFFDASARKKPLGTAHAVLCAKDVIKNPFAVINADDFYGKGSYKILNEHLTKAPDSLCMVGFKLANTLSENGSVSRGICKTEGSVLKSVVEHTSITKDSGIDLDSIVSMNMWGLNPSIFDELEKCLHDFLKNIKNPEKDEFYLPLFIDNIIQTKNEKVTVLKSDEKWYGMTYKEDIQSVKDAVENFINEGYYNEL